MGTQIHSQDLDHFASGPSTSKDILTGEIDGLRTVYHTVSQNQTIQSQSAKREGRVYIFTAGSGSLEAGGQRYPIDQITFFAPTHNTPFSVSATSPSLCFLELIVSLGPADLQELEDRAAKYPIYLPYAKCKTYKERIKSEKTTSRTLLPEYTFPRLCIGSVETTGDDQVAPHKHPMLEQLFFGLADNNCILSADECQMEFKEGVLLHIPLGSTHGVRVKAPNKLHYIWIDLFRDPKGMEWIVQEHIHQE